MTAVLVLLLPPRLIVSRTPIKRSSKGARISELDVCDNPHFGEACVVVLGIA